MVELLVDEVDGAAGEGDAVVEGLLLGVKAGEGGQERGVDVEDAVGEGGDKGGRDEAQVAGEADEIDGVGAEVGEELGVVLGAFAAEGGDGGGGVVEFAGTVEAGGVGKI